MRQYELTRIEQAIIFFCGSDLAAKGGKFRERFWVVPTTHNSLLIIFTRKHISTFYYSPALYITLTLTHKDKDRETESEKERRAETTSLLLGFLVLIAVS